MAIILIRTMIIYFALLIAMRLLGKRQLGELEVSEFVITALIADLASHPLQDLSIPLINGLVPILTLFCCEVFIAWGTMKSIQLRAILFGKPSFLIKYGKIAQKELEKNRLSPDELMQQLRNQGCMDISKVQYAILETDGRVNIIKYPKERPASAEQMGISDAEDGGYQVIVISAGHIIEDNLKCLGLGKDWLKQELCAKGITAADEVFFMAVNEKKQSYITKKETKS